MQTVPRHGHDRHDRATRVQIYVVFGFVDQLAEGGGRALGRGTLSVAGADPCEVEFVLCGTGTPDKGGFVDDGDNGELPAPQLGVAIPVKELDQSARGRHRFELVTMDPPGDQQLGTCLGGIDAKLL